MQRFRNARLVALLPGLVLALGLVACEETEKTGLTLSDAWARAAPAGAITGAVYLTLQAGARADRLVGVDSPQASRATLHDMRMDGEIMRMRKLDAIPLPAGRAVHLAPGGVHIMLMGLSGPLREGETLTLRLRFAHAPAMEIRVPILGLGATGLGATGSSGPSAD